MGKAPSTWLCIAVLAQVGLQCIGQTREPLSERYLEPTCSPALSRPPWQPNTDPALFGDSTLLRVWIWASPVCALHLADGSRR